ncbi:hypothetical protein ACO02O_08604 [Dirofilaria immitis]
MDYKLKCNITVMATDNRAVPPATAIIITKFKQSNLAETRPSNHKSVQINICNNDISSPPYSRGDDALG